jgi:hypothetical protein
MEKKNSGKAPSFQMYPKDWNQDHDLKMCSFAAEGLWIRLVNTSFEMPVKGVFIRRLNGSLTALKLEEIANLIRGNTREKKRLLRELIANNVLKQMTDGDCAGAFYVKRIYEDMKLRAIRAEAGKLGGNPNLVKNLDGNLLNQNPEQTPKQNPTPSSSTSSSISLKENNNTKENITFAFAAGTFGNIKPEDIGAWQDAYPAVDVHLSIRQAAQWLVSNPTKRKKNYRRFLTNWFARTQEKGGNKHAQKSNPNHRPSLSEQDWGQELIPTGKNEM